MHHAWLWNVLNLYAGLEFFLFVCTLYVKTMLTFSTGCNNMYMRACNYLDLVLPLQLSRDHGLLLFPNHKGRGPR